MSCTSKLSSIRIASCLAALALSQTTLAQKVERDDVVDASNIGGSVSFSHSVPLDAPDYYGIEPKLSLHYNVNSQVGLAGPGWDLTGFSTIERRGPTGGLPLYNTTDRLYLDGQELISCTGRTAVSPGCANGGTHVTKIENYAKIVRTGETFVVCKEGICTTYQPIICTASGPFRWGIAQVADLLGHTTTYAWENTSACTATYTSPTPAFAYPSSVSYNKGRYVVSIRYDNSINKFPQATGAGNIVRSRRIKNILITVLGKAQSAFGLTYGTGNDILAKIQPYGSNVTFDAASTINGGSTELPAQTFIAEANSVAFSAAVKLDSVACPRNGTLSAVDINGDGYSDFVCVHARLQTIDSASGIEMFLNQKNGTFAAAVALGYPGDAKKEPLLIDVNCDQRPDIIWIANTCPAQWKARLNQGNGAFSAEIPWGNLPTDVNVPVSSQFADLNGDGCTEYIYPSTTSMTDRLFRIMYGQPNKTSDSDVCLGTAQPFVGLPGEAALDGWSVPKPFRFSDVDGNGATDLLYFKDTSTLTSAEIKVIFGTGYAIGTTAISLGMLSDFYSLSTLSFGRLAGGRGSDMVYIKAGQGRVLVRPWDNAAQQFGAVADVAAVPTGVDIASLSFGDFDGDGKQDIVLLQNESATQVRPWTYRNISGDARLVEIRNGIGGVRKLVYANAAAQPNSVNVPAQWVVSSSTEIIGTQSATTSYAYSGGLYDPDEKRFIGFAKITRTEPCVGTVCPQTIVYYDMDYTGARPIRIDRRDVTNAKTLAVTLLRYSLTNTLPYKNQLAEKWEYLYSAASTAVKRNATEYAYNFYGQVTAVTEYGEGTTPLRLRVTDYAPTVAATYLVQPSRTALYSGGTQLDANKIEETRLTYDTTGKLKKKEQWMFPMPEGATTPYVTTLFDYDTAHRLITTTAPLNRITRLTYETDLELFVANTTNPAGQVSKKTWNTACGQPAVETGLNGETVTHSYDAFCRRYLKTYAPGTNYEKTIYVVGTATVRQNTRVETPSADGVSVQWSENYFDGAGRTFETRQKGPTTIVVSKTYDLHGRLATESRPYYLGQPQYAMSYKYDALGRQTEEAFASGEKRTTSYTERSICRNDEEGHSSCEDLDGLGRVITKRELASGSKWVNTSIGYNVRGDVISLKDALGNITGFDYNSTGQVVAERDLARGNTTRTYNAAGELTREVNALGEMTVLVYDALGRLSSRTTRFGTAGAEGFSFTYDLVEAGFGNVGRVTRATDASGYSTYRYNVSGTLNRVVRHFNAQGDVPPADQTTTYSYDAADRISSALFADGTALKTTYDAAARPASLVFVQGAANRTLASVTYDAAGNKTGITQENGFSTIRTYSPQRGWLNDSKTTATGETTPRIGLIYGRDKHGLIRSLSRTIAPAATETITYSYDWRHQLLSAASSVLGTQTWTYDDIGRVLTSPMGTYCYNASSTAYPAPQAVRGVVNCATPGYQYNAIGQLTSGPASPTNAALGTRTLVYNGRGLIQRVTIARAAGEQSHIEDYAYDANGLRVRTRIASGSCAQSDAINTYTLPDEYEITQVGSTDMLTQHFSLAGELVARRVKVEAGKRCATCTKTTQDTITYLHADHLGSVVAESKLDKTIINPANYRAYGEETNQPVGPTARVHRGYLGQRRDATGLLYLNARYYDSTLTQFTTTDPVRSFEQTVSLHPYSYSQNDPVNRSDVSGMLSLRNDVQNNSDIKSAPSTKTVGNRPYDKVTSTLENVDQKTTPEMLANSLKMIPTAEQTAIPEPMLNPVDFINMTGSAISMARATMSVVGRGLTHAYKSTVGGAFKTNHGYCLLPGGCTLLPIADATGKTVPEVAKTMSKNGRWSPGSGSNLVQVSQELHDARIALASPLRSLQVDAMRRASPNNPVIIGTKVWNNEKMVIERHMFQIHGLSPEGRPLVIDPGFARHVGPMDWGLYSLHYQRFMEPKVMEVIKY